MKLLVLYALAGGGHLSAARALKALMERPGLEVELQDATVPLGRAFDFCSCDLYRFSAKYVPRAFGFCYRVTDRRSGGSRLMRTAALPFARRLLPILREKNADVIVCAYPLACELVSVLKEKGLLQAKTIHLLTDYGPHAAWITPSADGYAASCREEADALMRRGVPPQKIAVCGIPVQPKFYDRPDRAALRRALGLSPEKAVLLFMAGSFGVRSVFSVFRAIDRLPEDFEAVVVTGRNEPLLRRFQALEPRHALHAIGFTDRVADYMHAGDLLITKPGGLTVSEALAAGIPLAVFDPIPGQEEDNANFLETRGLAVTLRSSRPEQAERTVAALLDAPEKLDQMRARSASFQGEGFAARFTRLLEQTACPSAPEQPGAPRG